MPDRGLFRWAPLQSLQITDLWVLAEDLLKAQQSSTWNIYIFLGFFRPAITWSWDKTIAISSHHRVPNSKIFLSQNYEILPFMWNQQPTDISRAEIPLKCKTKASNWTRYSVVIFILPTVARRYFLVLSVRVLHCGQDPSHPSSWLKPCQWISITQYNSAMRGERSNKLPTTTVLEAWGTQTLLTKSCSL